MDKGWLLAQEARILQISIEVQGMIAMNQYRISKGETITYNEQDFVEKATETEEVYSHIMMYR